ncbi:At2g23090-like protein [Trypanosoma melophagium]|uniref:At2g23090-like protein n=1 Tax=Trypanosoma melophagium TaxID=715481 RepID=UPI00351A451F|nr:At2g23090-like protein [Trypanosoma melophagium]
MPSGNGCRANQRRAREQAKDQRAGAPHTAEDRKKHEAAKNAIQCVLCFQGFPRTVRRAELEQHVESRHAKANKTVEELFPNFTE